MKKSINKDIYYTRDYEWIDYQGTVAYVGVCDFKLIGFKQIDKLEFKTTVGFQKQGEVLASIVYNDYKINIHMPVDGTVVKVNDKLYSYDESFLLKNAENSAWVALIIPLEPYERKDLLTPVKYQAISRISNKK